MNILYIMRYWPVYGGGETVTATLANELVKRGHQIHIAYFSERKVTPMPYILNNKIKAFKMHTIEGFTSKDIKVLHTYIIDQQIEVMINQWGNITLCAKAKKDTNCKLITCLHVNILMDFPITSNSIKRMVYNILGKNFKNWWSKYRQLSNHRINYKLSDKYVFLSPSFINLYKNLSGEKDKIHKITAIANPITYTYKYDITQNASKQKEVLFVGRLYEFPKRLSYIIKIWNELEKDSTLNDWTLTIVGDGPDLKFVKDLANSFNLKRIHYVGFTNPQPYYERASIFMMTSATEGFGMTIVEAQQYGVVPIAMDSYLSLHDIISNNENGIIIPNNDIQTFVSEMKNIMNNDVRRKELSTCAINSCKKFSVQTICNQWEQLFRELKDESKS